MDSVVISVSLSCSAKKTEAICSVVSCDRPLVYYVKRDLFSELLKVKLDTEEISKVLGCGKTMVLRVIKCRYKIMIFDQLI